MAKLRRENYFTEDTIDVAIAVDAPYWLNKIGRIRKGLADLYNQLFPLQPGGQDDQLTKTQKRAVAQSRLTAIQLWKSIKENPQSPPGPLTLAAICKAVAEGANFDDPRDRRAFLELMEHNEHFQTLFFWGMIDDNARIGTIDQVARQMLQDETMLPHVRNDKEALRLSEVWNIVYCKIRFAIEGRKSEFYKEFFEFAPSVAHAYPSANAPAQEDSLKFQAIHYTGIMAAAVLGFEKSPGHLNSVFEYDDIRELLSTKIRWQNVYLRRKISGSFDMKSFFKENQTNYEPAAFLTQLESNDTDFLSLDLTLISSRGDPIAPTQADAKMMFEELAWATNNALDYFYRYRPDEINILIHSVANLRLSALKPEERNVTLEIRSRLYHPVTIRAMAKFWKENFEAFTLAAGENDQYLEHLFKHMPDPVNFFKHMLRKDSNLPSKFPQAKRWAYFAPRFAKILPVIAKTQGVKAEKAIEELLVLKLRSQQRDRSVSEEFRSEIEKLVGQTAEQFSDSAQTLLAVLDVQSTRDYAKLSPKQVVRCLKPKAKEDPSLVNTRIEAVVARDDRLFAKVPPPVDMINEYFQMILRGEEVSADNRAAKFNALYPTLWARFTLNQWVKKVGLIAFVQQSGSLLNFSHSSSRAYQPSVQLPRLSVREAFVIASNESYWNKINPYRRHPFRAFFEWLIPGSQKAFFDEKKNQLASKSPILALRMKWEKNKSQHFDQYLVGKLSAFISSGENRFKGVVISNETKKEWAALVADIGRGPALLALSKAGDLAVPQNLSRAKAFLSEVNTSEKLNEAYEFILKIDVANIDAEAIFQLMTRDEALGLAAQESEKTFWGLAKELIRRNPSVLTEILELHTKRNKNLTPAILDQLFLFMLDGDFVLAYQSSVKEGIDALIQKLIIDTKVQNKLTAERLLRIRNISQATFEKLIKSDSDGDEIPSDIDKSLRDKNGARGSMLVDRLFELESDELAQVGVIGLGSLFKMHPECLAHVLLKLPSVDSPENGSDADKEDIFRLIAPGRWGKRDLSPHPFYAYMMSADFRQVHNITLVIRCINSRNEYLSKLMRQVMTDTLMKSTEVDNVSLLMEFLCDKGTEHDTLEEILSEHGKLSKEIKKLILNNNFIGFLSSATASGNYDKLWLRLWLVLLHSPSFRLFIDNLSFNKSDPHIVALVGRLSRYYDLFKREHLKEIPVLELPAPGSKLAVSKVPKSVPKPISLAKQSGLFRQGSATSSRSSVQKALSFSSPDSPSKDKGLSSQSKSSSADRKKSIKIKDPVAALQKAYDEFNFDPFEGQQEWREELVQVVLKEPKKTFSLLKPLHFAVLLAISPEKTGPVIATYLSQEDKSGIFDAIISDPKTGVMPLIMNRSEFRHYSKFRPLIVSWIGKDAAAKKHYRSPEVIQWLHQNNRFGQELWPILMGELTQGINRELLGMQPVVGPVLWERLIDYLNSDENQSDREKCLKDDQFLKAYLLHLTQKQRVFLFNTVSDDFLMRRVFALCASDSEFMNVLFSVLLRCFSEVDNPFFYQVLKEYPHFFDYALNIVDLETLTSFLEKNKEQQWCDPELFKKRVTDQAVKAYYSGADKNRIKLFLDSICSNHAASRELEDVLLVDYYSVGDQGICSRILANPVLLERILLLSIDKRITIEWTTHIRNLLGWMLDVVQAEGHKNSVNFLLVEKRMTYYFIGAIEWFFIQDLRTEYKGLLDSLFKYFGPDFFGGITREQLGLLVKIHGDNTLITAEFNQRFPGLVNSYRTLIPNEDEEILRRWKETVEIQAEFVEEFRYRGPDDDKLWMRLLLCNWRGDLNELSILDTVVQNAMSLNLVGFLKAHSQNEGLNELFTRKQSVAEKVLYNPQILSGCEFTLENFVCWDYTLLRTILQNSSLHKISGFTPEHFYRLAFSRHRERVFAKKGFIASLFLDENESENSNANGLLCYQGFLRDTFLTAPAYVKELMPLDPKPRVQSPNSPSSWLAKREKPQDYLFTERFEKEFGKGKNTREADLGRNPSLGSMEAYFRENSRQDHVFIKALLGSRDIQNKLKQNKGTVKNGDFYLRQIESLELAELNDILCKNILLRKVGIMRNPKLLREAIDRSMDFEYKETVYCIKFFLQLPDFRPTTEDLSPAYLRFETYDVAIQTVIKESPVSMVEYLIDLRHFRWENLAKDKHLEGFIDALKKQTLSPDEKRSHLKSVVMLIFDKAKILIEVGIAAFFDKWVDYQKENDVEQNNKDFSRFFCLLFNAIEWLEPKALLDLFKFERNKDVRDQVCKYALSYNCNIMPVSEVPALVELQLHLLRSYVGDLTKSANPYINNILWHLRCIPAEALKELTKRKVVLEVEIWKSLLWSPLLANWLRYETLTSTLSEKDLVVLVRNAKNADIARACLMNGYLHDRCSDNFFIECANRLGYGDDPMEMVQKLKQDMGLVTRSSLQLQEWVQSIESPQNSYDY